MSIKKLINISVLALVIAISIPSTTIASNLNVPTSDSLADVKMYSTITTRLAEIQSMDLSTLSKSEKKELKKELKQMEAQAGGLDKRVYLSIGAIIIIILLLILIL
jgi:hypothetical protein